MAEIETINGNPIVAEVASESLAPVVDAWMTAHPDVTTTVQDGAISKAKIAANVIPKLMGTISPSNYSTQFPTFNADFETSIYTFSSFSYGSTWPTGGPYTKYQGTANSLLVNIKQDGSTIIEQLFIDYGTIWRRYINPAYNSYPTWTAPVKATMLIDAGNYATRLPAVKNSEPNTNYILNFAAGSTSIPADLPTSYWEGGMASLWCVDDFYHTTTFYIFTVQNSVYTRVYNRSNGRYVSEWRQVAGSRTLYVSKNVSGTGFYSNFTNACLDAYNDTMTHPTVRVLDGTYDVGAELTALLGDLESLSSSSSHVFKYGIALGGYDIECGGGATLTFDYSGDNAYVLQNVSMFDCRESNGSDPSFKISGMNASGSRLRYLIHDDTGGTTRKNRIPVHAFENCTLSFDNRGNASRVGAQVIGGGLGIATVVNIENCVFIQQESTVQGTVTYHNNAYANSKSRVNIDGCYFTAGGVIFGNYGSSTLQTVCTVSNCSMTYGPTKRQEAASANDNMTLYAWNNELRQS